jgi:hypothetical protein
MSCILIRCTYDKNDPAISSGIIALFAFSVLAPWWPSKESNWKSHIENLYNVYKFRNNLGKFQDLYGDNHLWSIEELEKSYRKLIQCV